jgi:hypothetical protein
MRPFYRKLFPTPHYYAAYRMSLAIDRMIAAKTEAEKVHATRWAVAWNRLRGTAQVTLDAGQP